MTHLDNLGEVVPPNAGWVAGRFPRLISAGGSSLRADVLHQLEIFTLPLLSQRFLGVWEDNQLREKCGYYLRRGGLGGALGSLLCPSSVLVAVVVGGKFPLSSWKSNIQTSPCLRSLMCL